MPHSPYCSLIVFVVLICLAPAILFSQVSSSDLNSIDDWLNEFVADQANVSVLKDNIIGYTQPFVDGLGANLNSGLYYSAKIPRLGLHVYMGMQGMLALISDDQTTFTAEIPDGPNNTVVVPNAPTLFGSTTGKTVRLQNADPPQTLKLRGLGFRLLPIVVPRIAVSGFKGTEISVRYIPAMRVINDLGKFSLTGFGLRHSMSQYFPLAIMDFSFGFFVQDVEFNSPRTSMKVSTSYFGVQISKSITALTLYGGFGTEISTMNLTFLPVSSNPQIHNATIRMDMRGKNVSRINMGMTLSFLPFIINVDYNVGAQHLVCVGAGIGF